MVDGCRRRLPCGVGQSEANHGERESGGYVPQYHPYHRICPNSRENARRRRFHLGVCIYITPPSKCAPALFAQKHPSQFVYFAQQIPRFIRHCIQISSVNFVYSVHSYPKSSQNPQIARENGINHHFLYGIPHQKMS